MKTEVQENLLSFKQSIPSHVQLLAVSKTKQIELIQEAYNAGQRDFGENKVQELREKHPLMPSDINWHMIGHLQRNKVKYIAPFVYMIHAVDSIKLLKEINARAAENNRTIKVLLQVHIAQEESKFGFNITELKALFDQDAFIEFSHVEIAGIMAMATNTPDSNQIKNEFVQLKSSFEEIKEKHPQYTAFRELSIGMSNDFKIAIEAGSTMIRIGSSIFGARNYSN